MADLVRITTSRGSTKIGYKGYLYNKNKTLANEWISYECEQRPKKGNQEFQCKARMKVKGDDVIEINSEHSHAPDQAKIEALMAKMDIIQRAAATQETPQQILAACSSTTGAGSYFIYLICFFFC